MKQNIMEPRKILQIHWHGRFGNRMFTYAFCNAFARKYNLKYYLPSEWEGSHLFVDSEYAEIIPDDELRLHVNQSHKSMDTREYRTQAVENYKRKSGDTATLVTLKEERIHTLNNLYFDDLDCMYVDHCYKTMDTSFVKSLFQFNTIVKNSQIYRELENLKGTYDLVHLRRGDIAMAGYKGAHSMISRDSYVSAVEHYEYNVDSMVWISDNESEFHIPYKLTELKEWHKKWNQKAKRAKGHWFYPTGERKDHEVFFDFFPDFLLLIFARTIFRGNSAFSWWGAFLSDAKVYSPVIQSKPIEKKEKFHVQNSVAFVEGNYPHFMGSLAEGFINIILNDDEQKSSDDQHQAQDPEHSASETPTENNEVETCTGD